MSTSILEQEIYQQPQVIRDLISEETGNVKHLTDNLRGRFKYILIAARGTSDNAARYAQYLFGAKNQIPVALATPSLFSLYQKPPCLDGALVIGISQSGQSPDIVSVLAEAKIQRQPTLAITNEVGSPLASTADWVIPLHVGIEQATAASKTYTASLAVLTLISARLANSSDQLSELAMVPDYIQKTLDGIQSGLSRVERYRYMDRCAVISRGYNYATAFEIALKIKELTRVVAEPYSSADFQHGPIATVQNGFPIIMIAPSGSVNNDLRNLIRSLTKLDSELLIISNDEFILQNANLAFPIPPDVPEWLTPLIAVIPGQMFSLRLTQEKGMNPDQPSGITKVTETF